MSKIVNHKNKQSHCKRRAQKNTDRSVHWKCGKSSGGCKKTTK